MVLHTAAAIPRPIEPGEETACSPGSPKRDVAGRHPPTT